MGLLNVLEEQGVQIRGFKVRLPLDVVRFASANPEDYTNRGRLITPLKDRFGAQIRTHYPLDATTEQAIVDQEARPLEGEGFVVTTPPFMSEVVATLSQLARRCQPHQPALGGVGAPHGDERRDAGESQVRPDRRCGRARTTSSLACQTSVPWRPPRRARSSSTPSTTTAVRSSNGW